MLDEQQGGRDGLAALAADDVGIEDGLQVVVAVVVNLRGVEDGIHVGHGLQPAAARLVVDHADALLRRALANQVEPVDAPADAPAADLVVDVALQPQDGERCQPAVNLKQLPEIVDDDLAVDDVQSARRHVGQLAVERLVNGALYLHLRLQQMRQHVVRHAAGQLVVDDVGSLVEHVAEHAVVQLLLVIGHFRFQHASHVAVVEPQLAAQVAVDGRRAQRLQAAVHQ